MATEARQAARAWPIWVYSMVKDYESRAGTGLLAAKRAELQVTAVGDAKEEKRQGAS